MPLRFLSLSKDRWDMLVKNYRLKSQNNIGVLVLVQSCLSPA